MNMPLGDGRYIDGVTIYRTIILVLFALSAYLIRDKLVTIDETLKGVGQAIVSLNDRTNMATTKNEWQDEILTRHERLLAERRRYPYPVRPE